MVSIVVANFNNAQFLRQCLESLVKQTYPNLEIVICDDASDDDSVNIINAYQMQYSNIILITNETRKGVSQSRHNAILQCSGEYISSIDGDDYYSNPSKIMNEMNLIKEYKDRGIDICAFSNTLVLQENSITCRERGKIQEGNLLESFLSYNGFIPRDFTYLKKYYFEVGGYDLTKSLHEDTDLKIRLAVKLPFYYTRHEGVVYRRKGYGLSYQAKDSYRDAMEAIFTSYSGLLKDDDTKRRCYSKLQEYIDSISVNVINNQYDAEKWLMEDMKHRRGDLNDFLAYMKNRQGFYPDVIVDVGVAYGTPELYSHFPEAHILLIEPLSEFKDALLDIQRQYANVDIESVAAGRTPGSMKINVHDDLLGSSLLKESESKDVNGYERIINVETLDNIAKKHALLEKNVLLKIDVQGAELEVIEGALNFLTEVEIIIMEVSLYDFFVGGYEFSTVITAMRKKGYVVYDFFGFLNRPYDASLAQIDIAFVKAYGRFKQSNVFALKEQRDVLNQKSHDLQHYKQVGSYASERMAFSVTYNSLFEHIQRMRNNKMKYVVYGHGTVGKTIHALMPEEVVGFVDIKSELFNVKIKSNEVYSPKNLKNMKFDKIIISVLGREQEIEDYLVNECDVDRNAILRLLD